MVEQDREAAGRTRNYFEKWLQCKGQPRDFLHFWSSAAVWCCLMVLNSRGDREATAREAHAYTHFLYEKKNDSKEGLNMLPMLTSGYLHPGLLFHCYLLQSGTFYLPAYMHQKASTVKP